MSKTFVETGLALSGQDLKIERAASLARHRAWLKRSAVVAGCRDPWRPIKRYRTSTVKWIAQNDNQLRVCTAMEGLQFLKPDWASPQWAEGQFESWPYASVALDQGGDGLSGYFACAYKPELRLNLLAWFD